MKSFQDTKKTKYMDLLLSVMKSGRAQLYLNAREFFQVIKVGMPHSPISISRHYLLRSGAI